MLSIEGILPLSQLINIASKAYILSEILEFYLESFPHVVNNYDIVSFIVFLKNIKI